LTPHPPSRCYFFPRCGVPTPFFLAPLFHPGGGTVGFFFRFSGSLFFRAKKPFFCPFFFDPVKTQVFSVREGRSSLPFSFSPRIDSLYYLHDRPLFSEKALEYFVVFLFLSRRPSIPLTFSLPQSSPPSLSVLPPPLHWRDFPPPCPAGKRKY